MSIIFCHFPIRHGYGRWNMIILHRWSWSQGMSHCEYNAMSPMKYTHGFVLFISSSSVNSYGISNHIRQGFVRRKGKDSMMIGFGDYTDLLWWKQYKNYFCQFTTRIWDHRTLQYTGSHTYLGLKKNRGMPPKNGLQNVWGNIVFFILC